MAKNYTRVFLLAYLPNHFLTTKVVRLQKYMNKVKKVHLDYGEYIRL